MRWLSDLKRRIAGFLAAVSTLMLLGCASAPVETGFRTPPAALLEDCPIPAVQTKTNGDLADGVIALRQAIKTCNNDKEALREWAKDKQ